MLFSCGKKTVEKVIEPDTDQIGNSLYAEGVEALNEGDAFYAAKKFREAEISLTQYDWSSKASLMVSYAEYSRSAYSNAVFELERHIENYPADNNLDYAHYLVAMCYLSLIHI